MTQPTVTVVGTRPRRHLPRLGMGALSFLLLACSFVVLFGPRSRLIITIFGVIIAVPMLLILLCLGLELVGLGPRIVLNPDGFVSQTIVYRRSRKWADVDGQFAVVKIRTSEHVAYNLTPDCKARAATKPASAFSGYDEILLLGGAFGLSATELAELLNEHRQRSLENASARSAGS